MTNGDQALDVVETGGGLLVSLGDEAEGDGKGDAATSRGPSG